jgi:SET domain-containing protein
VFVGQSPLHGRGVFAARSFQPGEMIEDCPVLLVPASTVSELHLDGYCFEWDEDRCAIALGYGSLYNHSWRPNARYDHDHELDVVTYTAVRSIEAGDEITINYTGDPDGRMGLWFNDVSPT